MTKTAKIGWNGLWAIGLAAGLVWTAYSAQRGWTMHGWSDASRQWVVCQYVRARINPYELAQRLLRDTFGPATGPDRVRLKEHRIYSISSAHWTPETPGLLPGQPPPEATYPPSTMSMLLPTIGFLPERWLLPVYTTANLVFLALLLFQFGIWLQAETRWPLRSAWGAAAALGLLWPPLQYVVQNGQAGIVSVLCAWLAIRRCDRTPLAAGFLFLAALVKPSMALLFFIVPLVRGTWKPIWTAFFAGLLLTVLPAVWLREWPWVLLAQWMDLCRYVLQGAFTVQEILNALGWENTWRGLAVVLGIWGAALAWCVRHRRARPEALFALLALANLAWTYHERHDFVLLAFLLVWFAAQAATPGRRGRGGLGLALCAVLGAALADTFYIPAAPWAHAVRWAGRLAIPALWALTALDVRASHAANPPPSAVDLRRPV
ncbi:MAG: glycosyltransferase family 87 protein [Kiritimatiellia bacterium]